MNIFTTMAVKHIAKKTLFGSMKRVIEKQNEDVIMEKLGVRTIDEFMKLDHKERLAKKNGL